MIKSIAIPLMECKIPHYEGEIKMLPFNMETLEQVPELFKSLISKMINLLPIISTEAFLTVDGRFIDASTSHRRPGAHIDGNFIPMCGWGREGVDTGGWKVGENGPGIETEYHKLSYLNPLGGMLIVSDYPGCKGWVGDFEGYAGIGGDCRNIDLDRGFILEPNRVYYGNSQFIHESIPVAESVHRNLVRITLPIDYPVIIN